MASLVLFFYHTTRGKGDMPHPDLKNKSQFTCTPARGSDAQMGWRRRNNSGETLKCPSKAIRGQIQQAHHRCQQTNHDRVCKASFVQHRHQLSGWKPRGRTSLVPKEDSWGLWCQQARCHQQRPRVPLGVPPLWHHPLIQVLPISWFFREALSLYPLLPQPHPGPPGSPTLTSFPGDPSRPGGPMAPGSP